MSGWVFDPAYNAFPATILQNMDFVVDKVDHSVAEFYESFGHNLPKTVIVTQGFFGEIVDDTFDKDQVYRIHTTSRQKRVIAKSSDRHYSIPLNYPLKVCVVKKHGKVGKEQTLKDLVADHAFPIDVRFAGKEEFAVGGSTTCANRFPQLKLIDVFDEVYFLANTIIDGVLDIRVVPIPLYLSLLRLAELTGIKNQPQEKWKRYTTELSELVSKSVEFDLSYGNKDIADYHQDEFKADTIYTYIEPRTYSNIFSVNQFQPSKGPSVGPAMTETSSNVYEEIQKTNRRSDIVKPLNEVGGKLQSFFEAKQRNSVVGRPVPSLPSDSSTSDRSPTSKTESAEKEKKTQSNPKLPKRDPSTKVSTAPRVPPKPNPYVNDIPRGTVTPTSQPTKLQKPPSPSPASHQAHPGSLVVPQTKSSSSRIENEAAVNNGGRSGSTSSEDFNVASLSIQELSDCMKTLKLTRHISAFRDQMVDGTILKELDTEVLKADFGFTSIEAIRLMKFSKDGHIPK